MPANLVQQGESPMTTGEKPQKINLGFEGGQSLSLRVAAEELSKLRAALGGTGWYDLASETGTLAIDLAKVVYLLVDSDPHRVGFGS